MNDTEKMKAIEDVILEALPDTRPECEAWLEGWVSGVTDSSLTSNRELYSRAMEFLRTSWNNQFTEEAPIGKLRAAIEAVKAAKLEVKKDLAMALEDSGVITQYGCPIGLPLEDGSQVSLDLQSCLFDPEDENDGYCHIAIIPPGADRHDARKDIDYNTDGYEICPEPALIVKAVELELRRELRALQEWNKRVVEVTRLLSLSLEGEKKNDGKLTVEWRKEER